MAATSKRMPPKNSKPPMNPHRYQAALTNKKSRIEPTPIARITPTMANQNFAPRPSSYGHLLCLARIDRLGQTAVRHRPNGMNAPFLRYPSAVAGGGAS